MNDSAERGPGGPVGGGPSADHLSDRGASPEDGGADGIASLSGVAIRRRSRRAAAGDRKSGDITEVLRNMRAAPEVLARQKPFGWQPEPDMRDVTPGAGRPSAAPPRAEQRSKAAPYDAGAHPSRPARPVPGRKEAGDIVARWHAISRGGRAPSRREFLGEAHAGADDGARDLKHWSRSVLLRFDCVAQSIIGAVGGMAAPVEAGADDRFGDDQPGGEAEHSALLTNWMLRMAKKAGVTGRPVVDRASFPSRSGSVGYRLAALPLCDGPAGIDHVLCQLDREGR